MGDRLREQEEEDAFDEGGPTIKGREPQQQEIEFRASTELCTLQCVPISYYNSIYTYCCTYTAEKMRMETFL